MVPWLHGDDPFPPIEKALKSPNGLLCAGGDLSPVRRRLQRHEDLRHRAQLSGRFLRRGMAGQKRVHYGGLRLS